MKTQHLFSAAKVRKETRHVPRKTQRQEDTFALIVKRSQPTAEYYCVTMVSE